MAHWTEFLDPSLPDGALLPWKKVEPRVGISRTTAWRMQKTGEFPKPYVVSPGRVAYREREVEAWKVSRGHRAADQLVGRMSESTAPAPKPRVAAEPSSWSPSPPPLPEEPLPPASGARGPAASRAVRSPSRARGKRPGDDQMTFEF